MNTCVCGRPASKRCGGRCDGAVAYCSVACQRQAWPAHKKVCGRAAPTYFGELTLHSLAVKWCTDAVRGRHVVALADIAKGTRLWEETPLAAASAARGGGGGAAARHFGRFFPEGVHIGDNPDGSEITPESEMVRLLADMRRHGWTDQNVAGHFELASPEPGDSPSPLARAVAANVFRLVCGFTCLDYGAAMFHQSSSVNHSCCGGNARYVFGLAAAMHVTAARDIRAGEQITYSYTDSDALAEMCTHTRREHLRKQLGTDCICARCTAEPCVSECPGVLSAAPDAAEAYARAVPDTLQPLGLVESHEQALIAHMHLWRSHGLKGIVQNARLFNVFIQRVVGHFAMAPERELVQTLEFSHFCLEVGGAIRMFGGGLPNHALGFGVFSTMAALAAPASSTRDAFKEELASAIYWIRDWIKVAPWTGRNFSDFAPCVIMMGPTVNRIFESVRGNDFIYQIVLNE